MWLKRRIFLDHAGGEENPSGIHKEGVEAKRRLEDARTRVARILHSQARDVIFTSGATESDNIVIQGVVKAAKEKIKVPHIIISNNEHPAVEEAAKEVAKWGVEFSILPVEKISQAIKENTVLISVAYVNNETGALSPVAKISRAIKDFRKKNSSSYPYFHSDATQAMEFLPVDVERLGVDLLTIGEVLIVRPRVEIRPLTLGGGQERGLRAGTQNLTFILEFAAHLEDAESMRSKNVANANKLKQVFIRELERQVPGAIVNTPKDSVPNIVSISFRGMLHEFLAIKLDLRGVAVSTGSSCDSSKNEADKEALRFSWSAKTSEKEVKEAIRILREVVI